jgi:hypothetical protein
MDIWLLQIPAPIVGSLTVVIVVGLSVIGLVVFRRVVSYTRLERTNTVTGQVFRLAGVLYAVLVASSVVVVWGQLNSANAAAQSEASAVADLLRDSEALPAPVRPQLQQSLISYTQGVIDDEFPRMRRGESIEQQSEHLTQVWQAYQRVQPATVTEKFFYNAAISKLNDLGSYRTLRILSSQSEIPGELWLLLLGGGALVLAFTYIFGTPDLLVHACAVGLTAALMAFVMYLIVELDHPFVGAISVKPDAYVQVLEWSQRPIR